MQRYTLQIAFLAFDVSPSSKKLILNSYLWVKSTIILAKSIFLSDAIHICLSVASAKFDHLFMLVWFECDAML